MGVSRTAGKMPQSSESRQAAGHLAELEKALPIAQRYVANTEAANEKLGRLSAVLNSHGLEM
jgi:hypothetical protein